MRRVVYLERCRACASTFEAHNSRAMYCTDACRARSGRARQAAAVDVLRRQTRALAEGASPLVFAGLTREAERLLGDA